MKVAILGAGHGGHAMAAELSLDGHEVNLFNRSPRPVRAILACEGIEVYGARDGFAKLNKATNDVKEAIKGVKVIMVVVPSFGHRYMVELCVPFLEDGQVIVFNTGNFGALESANMLKEKGVKKNVMIAETECLIYATRVTEPARVWIRAKKEEVCLSSLPSKDTEKVLKVVNELYPQFVPATNVFDTSINNINFVIHPSSTIFNASRIEELGSYKLSHYGVTPSVARVMEEVDREKMAISRSLGLKPAFTKDTLSRYYGARGETFYETLCDVYAYKSDTAPPDLRTRYITEDVPYGLVPLSSLGDTLGVPTPTMKALIQIASLMNQTDYWSEGRTVEKLGLAGMSAEEMIKFVTG